MVKAMQLQVTWFLLASAIVISQQLVPPELAAAANNSNVAPLAAPGPGPGCPTRCGNVEIPYPFGLRDDCSEKGRFTITCNDSFSPPRPFWGNMEVIDISLEKGEARVVFPSVVYICYNSSNNITTENRLLRWTLNLTGSPALVSPTRNIFVAIGCSAFGFIGGREDGSFFTGCISTFTSLHDAAEDGAECTGLGCCQSGIPTNLSIIAIVLSNVSNDSWRYSPCSYAFVAEKGRYHFKRRDLTRVGNKSFTDRVGDRTLPVVLDWAIRTDGPCQEHPAKRNASACVSTNSYCINATQGPGYLCKCSKGYSGNPYIIGGCTNINECELRKKNPKIYERRYPCATGSTCKDMQGDYECKCKWYSKGDGKIENGCHSKFPGYAIAIVATLVAVLLACFAVALLIRRKQREQFNKNGGDILKAAGINIFTEGELKKITKSYSGRIGGGFFGDVYMGTINGTQVQHVAVKCSMEKKVACDRQKKLKCEAPQHEQEESWKEGFVREITFQFQIKHPNVVRLIGCCLETDVPILVFEFVPNGSLHDVLHGGKKLSTTLSVPKRLDIAIGSAEALSYIHSHGDHQHVHGDVKPANILLDNDLKPKVSDFGSSKLLSVKRYTVDVAADGSYTDPVYYNTGRFTVKSDVYSFGVVLLELITGKTARYGTKGCNSLTMDFKKACKRHGNGWEMYDADILSGNNEDAHSHRHMECLDMVGALAVRCLSEDVDERPTMAEVMEDLKHVKLIACVG